MKLAVFDMMKCKYITFPLLLLSLFAMQAQEVKYEREFRINRPDFPEQSMALLAPYLEDARRLKFYKELDGEKERFEAKYRRDGYYFSVEFDKKGQLLDSEIAIRKKEVPGSAWDLIEGHLEDNFRRYRVRKIQRRFPAKEGSPDITLKQAAAIEHLDHVKYELVISGKRDKGYREYELVFDADGHFERERIFAPSSYEHVLY